MGNSLSDFEEQLNEKFNVEELKQTTNCIYQTLIYYIVTKDELVRLYRRFCCLCQDDSEYTVFFSPVDSKLFLADFLKIPEVALNPLAYRVITLFDPRQEDCDHIAVDFKQFATIISIFSLRSSREDKLNCISSLSSIVAFHVYDIDNDGSISSQELFSLLKKVLKSDISDERLHQIVSRTISESSSEETSDIITFEDFKRVMESTDIETRLSVRL